MDQILYFAYGSNTNLPDLHRWCANRDIAPPRFERVGNAILPDRRLAFTRKSSSRNGGVLDVVAQRGCATPGFVFSIPADFIPHLDRKEGVPQGDYERLEAIALLPDGRELAVVTYAVAPDRRQPFVQPSPEYLAIVRDGYRQCAVEEDALNAAAIGDIRAGSVDALFVYGTWMRAEARWSTIREHNPECVLLAEVYGQLFDYGDYPALDLRSAAEKFVKGEFVRFANMEPILVRLDAIERFLGHGRAESLFRRVVTDVGMCDGHVRRAWVYVLNGDPKRSCKIPSGSWRAHRGAEEAFLARVAHAHLSVSLAPDSAAIEQILDVRAKLQCGSASERELAQTSQLWTALA